MHPRYTEWLRFVFDHDIQSQTPAWYFAMDAPEFATTPEESVALITLTFQRASEDLRQFTDAQVNQGLWFLVSPSGSDYMFRLKSGDVALAERVAAVGSIYDLYAKCFSNRCTQALGHLGESASDLNLICYMFWDICPLSYLEDTPDQQAMADAILSVLERTLDLTHRACREAALHGLSELTYNHGYKQRVRRVIDNFLASTNLDDALHTYALKARDGNVQ